jgi:DNA-binding CsgD family transcriptional regulator
MNFMKNFIITLLLFVAHSNFASPTKNPLMQKGWAALIKDNENEAFHYFWQAHKEAIASKNIADNAEALLYLGICSYGSSLEKGLQFVTQSLSEYKKLEKKNPEKALIGRYKCLQLISTIYVRQKKYDDALQLSTDVVTELKDKKDESGTLGLAYNTLGYLYGLRKEKSLSDEHYILALKVFEKEHAIAYLPTSYVKIGEIAQSKNDKENSILYYNKAFALAKTTENKQALVNAYIAIGKWLMTFENDFLGAEINFNKARNLAAPLTDKTFEIKTLEALIELKNKQQDYQEVSRLQNQIISIKDRFYSFEREQIVKSLEVQFEVSEKNRKLDLMAAEKEVSKLTNYLLLSILGLLVMVFTIIFFFLKRSSKRDKQLIKTKEALVELMEEQKQIKEQQFQNDIEFKESQLSAITIQMLEKNEMLEEIKTILSKKETTTEADIKKLINKYTIHDNNWKDFDQYFESINKNFYSRLKTKYPDISTNDLKICALIKLNLSIKEMASILNISPDSVKTARHRLRKKLQLNTEENLTDFILSV